MSIYRFFCDESYDSTNVKRIPGAPPFEPRSYVVGGFFGNQGIWEKVEKLWNEKNERVGVKHFHASHLNAGTYEFQGWNKNRRIRYSRDMLRILKDQKKRLHGISCGLYADDYRRIISPAGQVKMGHPYLVCFKTVIATLAEQMDVAGYPPEDRFSVLIDRNQFDVEAVRLFYGMKDNPKFRHGSRLQTCTPASSDDFAGLQAADLVAYETFRLMHGKRSGVTAIRQALNSMLDTTGFIGYQFGQETLERIKDDVDSTECIPDGLIIVPPPLMERTVAKE